MLADLAAAVSTRNMSLGEVLGYVGARLQGAVEVHGAVLFEWEPRAETLSLPVSYPGVGAAIGESGVAAARNFAAVVVGRGVPVQEVLPEPAGPVAALAVPVVLGGAVLGVVVFLGASGSRFDEQQVVLAQAATAPLARMMLTAAAEQEQLFVSRLAAGVRRLLEGAARAGSVRQAGELLAQTAAEVFQTERAGVYLVDSGGLIIETMGVGVPVELDDALRASLLGKRADASPVWRGVAGTLAPLLVEDAMSSPARPGGFVHAMQFRSYIAIPLLAADGPVGLVICGDASQVRSWSPRQAELAAQLAWEGALVVDSVRLRAAEIERVAELAHQAFHDPLTGLPNRALLMEHLTRALRHASRQGEQLALVLLDLNDFKHVNDTLGHHYGDVLLKLIAQRLPGLLRDCDTLARLGGDEFAVLLTTNVSAAAANQVATRITTSMQEPFLLGALPLRVVPSIGIALFPEHGTDAAALLQHADVAMYEAKRRGLGPTLYQADQDQSSIDRLSTYTELRDALTRSELVLHYQPKIDLRTARLVGVEALVRWQHPQRGLLAPDEFLPIAEATDLIDDLTRWVLANALAQWQDWARCGLSLDLAVNISAHNLRSPPLLRDVHQMLTGQPVTSRLILEITESAVISDPARAHQVLADLRRLGLRISMDDFGAGYSSLTQLRDLPIDELKMDRRLVRDISHNPRDAAIARTIIELGHRIGVPVVGEGVEDSSTLQTLTDLGCDHAQGFFLSRPLPAPAITAWAQQRTRTSQPQPRHKDGAHLHPNPPLRL